MFCVRVLEERTMSEKLFLLIKYFDILFEISQTFTTAPNVMVISPLSLTTTSCLSHLWRLLSFWPRLTLGLAAKRRIVSRVTCQLSRVTRHHGRGWKEVLLQGRGEKDPGQRDGPGSVRLQDTAVGNQRNRYPVSTRQPAAGSSRARLLIKYEISGRGRTDGWFHVKFYTNSNFWKLQPQLHKIPEFCGTGQRHLHLNMNTRDPIKWTS